MNLIRYVSACGLLLAASGVSKATIITNGDFESINIGNNFFLALPAGSTSLTGWTIEAPTASQGIDIISNRTGCISCSNTGEQAIDMAGTPGRASIFQDLSTIAGAQYLLTFFASSNGGAIANSLTIQWDGANVATISTPAQGTWTPFSFLVTASTASTRLEFVGNIDGNAGAFLDTVSADVAGVSTPEPSLGLFTGAAALVLAGLKLRRANC